jgi:multidrug resistance efflux pump
VGTANPIFTWVCLAQRIPVRIHIDEVPLGVIPSAGMSALKSMSELIRQPSSQGLRR